MAQSEAARPQRTAQDIALILASVMAMAFTDALVKLVSAELTVWQIFVARSLFAIPLLIGLLRASGAPLRLRAPGWSLLRSALLVLTWLAFYASLPVLDLSVAAVAVYTNPIIIALLSAALLGEPVTVRRWAGIGLGFLGVVAILRPGTEAFSWFTLLPLLAALFYALSMLLTRGKCQREAPLVLALTLHGSFLVAGLLGAGVLSALGLAGETRSAFPFLLDAWAPMGTREWGLMALLSLLSAAYFAGVARAYQVAAPTVIATFDYSYLIWAALWGFVFFTETPDAWTVGGMVLIATAGLLVAAPKKERDG